MTTEIFDEPASGGSTTPGRGLPDFGLLFRAIRHDSTILVGGLPALLVFSAALVVGIEFGTAVSAALWATILFLTGVGFVAGYRIGLRGWRLALEALLAGSAGTFMLLLKTFLH